MSKLSQKEAVYTAIASVLAESEITISENVDVAPMMSRERRASVNQILFEGFKAGTIELDRTFDDAQLKQYVSGLQSNWIRKDKRLNGGIAYVPKNPGSRVGSGDEELKAMRALLTSLTSTEEKAEVQGYIDERLAQIAASKVKNVTIDFAKLPAALAKFKK